ncbi:hypothetical protein CSOJ01_05855 [Colletotrichum sojae]|uniref:Uncharacterized protein n=1 Tax=Colletotrichum sojae TaxID=2175907 RepID=A0A8H6JEM6_9PEZI|nr:hypothetical protein CSOJ01_05855 [Colletotrichum sojae]
MIPPVEDAVLKNNPQFAALHHTLTTAILNPDGSSKKPLTKEQSATQEIAADNQQELADHRHAAARNHLLTRALSHTSPPEPKPAPRSFRPRSTSQSQASAPAASLPEALLDLLLLLPPLLTSESMSPDSAAVLLSNPPFTELESLLPSLGELVSSTLHSSAVSLARIANPTTNPSFLHRAVPSLQTTYAKLQADALKAKHALAKERVACAEALASLMEKHSGALTLLVRALEAKHGLVARSLEFRAAETALEARKAEVDAVAAREGVRADVYSPEAVAALEGYNAHLRDARVRLESAVASLTERLEGYGVGVEGEEAKEKTLREIAKKYRELEGELEDAKRDLERLGRA